MSTKQVFFLAAFAMCFASSASTEPRNKWFNPEVFAGLIEPQKLDYSAAKFQDYAFSGEDGTTIAIRDCSEALALDPAQVVPSEQGVVGVLKLNCKALELYSHGNEAHSSHLPSKLTVEAVAALPAAIASVIDRSLITSSVPLAVELSSASINLDEREQIVIETETDWLRLTPVARGDFDGDGIEDMLLSMGWRVKNAFGGGSALFLISKRSAQEPASATWIAP